MDLHLEDDIDEIMAAILGKKSAEPEPAPQPVAPTEPLPEEVPAQESYDDIPQEVYVERPSRGPIVASAFVLILIVGLGVAGYFKKDALANLFVPASPFSEELQEKVNYPLYYPTKLPEGFKLETGSIGQPEENILVYKISDESGNTITVSEQARNDSINFDALFDPEVAVDKFELDSGRAVVGTTKDGQIVANFITKETWLIVTSHSSYSSIEDIKLILASIKTS